MKNQQLIEQYALENGNQRRHIRSLQARIAELEEALRPFANAAIGEGFKGLDLTSFYQKDFRHARLILDKEAQHD